MSPAEQLDFFVSYTSADRPWAEWIAWVLEEAGYSVRIQAWDFAAGANFVLEMDEATRISQRTIAVLSPAFLESEYVQPEWAAAFRVDPTGKGRRLLTVRVRECSPDGLLGSVVYVDLVGLARDAACERLLSAAAGERAKPTRRPAFPGESTRVAAAPVFPSEGPPIWNVPAAATRFVDRELLLEGLAGRLTAGEVAALTQVQALHGLGGVGKTRVAVEFACRHRADYDVVWWLRCEDPVTMLADYAALSDALALPERVEREQKARAEAARRWLETNGRWLLVFDNAPGPEALHRLIPGTGSGHVLITSRHQGGWRGIADPYPVDVWHRQESAAFLAQRTGDRDAQAADAVADALGGLPLALEQAAAYVDSTQISLAGYRRRLQAHGPTLFERGRPPDYEHTVATTWELAFAELESEAGCAALLFCCAFLAPEQIPRELFATEAIADGVFAAADGELALDDALKRMLAFSLVTGDETYLSMHRLVQHVIRNRLGDQREHWLTISEQLIAQSFPTEGEEYRVWPVCERLLPHALAVTDCAKQEAAETPQTATLLFHVARYLYGRAQFGAAKTLYRRALHIEEVAYGPDDRRLASTLNNLGAVQSKLEELQGAQSSYERALAIDEVTYGPDDPSVAAVLGNLGGVLRDSGDLKGAHEHYRRAVHIYDAASYGPGHPEVADALIGLGEVLDVLGDPNGASDHYERALQISEGVYGPDHPKVAAAIGYLATILLELGDLNGARERLERALQIFVVAYGPDHPDVAITLNNLGAVQRELGDLEDARSSYKRALAIDEATYGADHPQVARDLNGLGGVLEALGDLDAARERHERALQISETAYGPDHLLVAETLRCLGVVLLRLEDDDGAHRCLRRAKQIVEAAYGPDHPETAKWQSLGARLK